jgi:hypothetical protein
VAIHRHHDPGSRSHDEPITAQEAEALINTGKIPIEVLDCKERPTCNECGNEDGAVCCVYDPCDVINKPKALFGTFFTP